MLQLLGIPTILGAVSMCFSHFWVVGIDGCCVSGSQPGAFSVPFPLKFSLGLRSPWNRSFPFVAGHVVLVDGSFLFRGSLLVHI